MKPHPILILALLAGLAGCFSPQPAAKAVPRYGWTADPDEDPATPTPDRFPSEVSARSDGRALSQAEPFGQGEGSLPRGALLARDGSVVADPVPGGVTRNDVLAHEMQPTATGRMYILELYQQAIDDRDALELEVGSLRNALEQRDAANQSLRAKLVETEADVSSKADEIQKLLEENQELAARLATAQIRRLEAERMLLEAKLEWLEAARTAAEKAEGAAAPATKPAMKPAMKETRTVPGP